MTIATRGAPSFSGSIGAWTALSLVVGNMVGSGIYLLPATLAPLGWNGTIGWIITIGGAMCLALVFARLGALLPLAGGPYAFARAAFGPASGFFVAWSYWVMIWAGNAAVAVGVVSALSLIVPGLALPGVPALAALVLVWGLIAVNIAGVAFAGRVQLVTTALKLVPLLAVIVVALLLVLEHGTQAIAAQPVVPIRAGTIAGAAAITFWGFLGVESATVPADRVIDAARVVPRVTLIGTASTGIVYLLVSSAITLLMPPSVTAASPAPVAAFLARSFGGSAGAVVALFAAISAFGALNGFILLQGEVPAAMAKGGVFPAWFAREGRHNTPTRAHLLSGVLVTLVTLANYTRGMGDLFAFIASISIAAGMLTYLVSALAAIRLGSADRLLVAASIVAASFTLWMLWGLGVTADWWGALLVLAGLPVYLSASSKQVEAPAGRSR